MVTKDAVVSAVVLANAAQLVSLATTKLLGESLAEEVGGHKMDCTAITHMVVSQIQKGLQTHTGAK